MFRTIIMVIYMIIVGVLSFVLIPLSYFLGLFSKSARDNFSFGTVKFFMGGLKVLCGAKVTYKGMENLPKKGEAVVFIGNHRSFFDIILTYPVLPVITGFAAKLSIEKWPVVGWWMSLVHCIFIDRDNQRQGLQAILKGIEGIKNGYSMMIFPEGSRSKVEGEFLEFKHGSFKLATKPKVKLIPVAYSNTAGVWENHLPSVKKANVIIEFCDPIDTATLSVEETKALPDRVVNIMHERVIANGKELGVL